MRAEGAVGTIYNGASLFWHSAGSSVIGWLEKETESSRRIIAISFGDLRGEFGESKGIEVLVEPFLVEQFGMGAGFHEAPFVEDENAIGPLDGRQAVGDHKSRAALHELFQRLLDEPFRLAIERGCRFIQ